MKIQCPCGAKYAFDITPEMVSHPITFVCSQCGVDSSAIVNQIIRESFGSQPAAPKPPAAAPAAPVAAPMPAPRAEIRVSSPPPVAAVPSAGLRVASTAAPTHSAEPAAAGEGPKPCLKHLGEMAHEHCVVCQKPICPKCMEMFGYVCSAFCRAKAQDKRIYIPPYAGQKSVAEAKYWRKSGLIFGSIIFSIVAVVAIVSSYKWFFSVPRVAFSVQIPDKAYTGSCRIIGENQVVFLHGGLLARHDMKSDKEVWSRRLIDADQIGRDAEKKLKEMVEDRKKALDEGIIYNSPPPTVEELRESMLRSAEASLSMYVTNGYLWVAMPKKLVKFDWQTGQPGTEIALEERYWDKERRGDELILSGYADGGEKVTKRVNLQTGTVQVDEKPTAMMASASTNATGARGQARAATPRAAVGAQTVSVQQTGGSGEKPLDPAAVAAAAQNLPLPSRIALPAVLSANRSQQRLMAEMRDMDDTRRRVTNALLPQFRTKTVIDGAETVEFSVALLEEKSVARQAMKAPPKRSVLDGDLRVTQTTELANEIFNDMQRDRTGGVEFEDASRYTVRLKRGEAEWSGEVTGSPSLYPLKSLDIVAPSKRIIVLDKQARKLWESALTHDVKSSLWREAGDEPSQYGLGPCVERGKILYIVDEGVISAFDAASGNAIWRLPTVGVFGLHFDDAGMIYVNTTTASPESLKYSQQIDISDRTHNTILKVEGSTGKTVWTAPNEGLVNYLSGKFIYTVASYEGDETEGNPLAGIPGATTPPHIRIKRLNPKNGRVMWEHYQRRAPIDIQIDKNTIQILFRKEMQVLKYFTL